jgi:hypothetical protein
MALKQDCEVIADRATRIIALIRMRQQLKVEIEENPDLAIDVTPGIKQVWNQKIDALQAEIKAIVQAW